MNALLYLIPIALGLGFLALCAFIWNIRNGQYDDLEADKYRIFDKDDAPLSPEEAKMRRQSREK